MAQYTLNKWSVVCVSANYQAPELCRLQLRGLRDNDNKYVITSYLVKIDGKQMTTRSGSVYTLTEPDPEYLAWMKSEGIPFDPENPIKDRTKQDDENDFGGWVS